MRIKKILLIDDDPDARRIGAMSLRKLGGFEVLLASSGVEGLGLAELARPDVILLDIIMPELDGWTTLVRLKKIPSIMTIPVILVTGRHDPPHAYEYHDAGAIGLIAKPFDPLKLPATMLEILNEFQRTARSAPCAT